MPGWLARGSGVVINMASAASSIKGVPNRFVYGATEAAMHLGMTMGLREMVVALVACLVMTLVSSLFAIRRLWRVDPIMLFE